MKTPVLVAWDGDLQDKFLSLNNKNLQDALCKIFKSRIREIGCNVIQQPKVQEYVALLKTCNNLVSVYDLFLHSLTSQSPDIISFTEKIFFSFDLAHMLTKIQYDKLQDKLTGRAPNLGMKDSLMRKLENCCPQFVDQARPQIKKVNRKRPLEDKESFKEDLTQPATISSLQIWDDGLPTAIPVPSPFSAPMLATSGFSLFSQNPFLSSLPIWNDNLPIAIPPPPSSVSLLATSSFSFFSSHNKKEFDRELISQCEVDEKLSGDRSTLNDFNVSQPALLTSLTDWMASLDKDEQDTSSQQLIKIQGTS